ncbi:LLGL2 isoform 11, partial [Pan troglodytes]
TRILWLTTRQGLPFTIFQGGMPRASYGDRHCISVIHDGQQTAFDFTSRVIDFTVLTEADPAAAVGADHCRRQPAERTLLHHGVAN